MADICTETSPATSHPAAINMPRLLVILLAFIAVGLVGFLPKLSAQPSAVTPSATMARADSNIAKVLLQPAAILRVNGPTGALNETPTMMAVRAILWQIKTERIVDRLIASENFEKMTWYKKVQGAKNDPTLMLQNKLEAKILSGSNLIALSFTDSIADENAEITNLFAKVVCEDLKMAHVEKLLKEIDVVNAERRDLEQELEKNKKMVALLMSAPTGEKELSKDICLLKASVLVSELEKARSIYFDSARKFKELNALEGKSKDHEKVRAVVEQSSGKYQLFEAKLLEVAAQLNVERQRETRLEYLKQTQGLLLARLKTLQKRMLELRIRAKTETPVTFIHRARTR